MPLLLQLNRYETLNHSHERETDGTDGVGESSGLYSSSSIADFELRSSQTQISLVEDEVLSSDTLTQGVVSAPEDTLAEETGQTGALEANGLEEISNTASASVDKEEAQCEALSAKVPLGEVEDVVGGSENKVMMKAVGSRDMASQVNTQMAHQQLSAAKATGVDIVGTNAPHYAQIVFNKKGAIPAPKNELYNVQYADIKT